VAILLVLIVAAIVAAIVVSTTGSSKTVLISSVDRVGMDASDRFREAASIILEFNSTSRSLLLDTSSPQYSAVQWLSEEDGFTLDFTRDVSKQELSVHVLLKDCGHAWER
jgi:hypothetical protein